MKVIFHPQQKHHNPRFFLSSGAQQANPEQPARADVLLEAATQAGLKQQMPDEYGLGPVARVHSAEYIDFLQNIYQRWQRIAGASAEVIPNIHPDNRNAAYPRSAVGQAGFHISDTSCPIAAQTWDSARWSANTAVHAAQLLHSGERSIYALCRPPGHHAARDLAGGFCYFNNIAVAAAWLAARNLRPAILDVDLHHGNGTQSIFYRQSGILTVSIHADPIRYYPFFWGHAEERGEAAGLGYNLNLPLARHSADAVFLQALDQALDRIRSFAPDVLLIALGLDAYINDPFAGLAVTTDGFARIAERCAAMKLPTLIVQEGGYLCPELGDNLNSFLTGFRQIAT